MSESRRRRRHREGYSHDQLEARRAPGRPRLRRRARRPRWIQHRRRNASARLYFREIPQEPPHVGGSLLGRSAGLQGRQRQAAAAGASRARYEHQRRLGRDANERLAGDLKKHRHRVRGRNGEHTMSLTSQQQPFADALVKAFGDFMSSVGGAYVAPGTTAAPGQGPGTPFGPAPVPATPAPVAGWWNPRPAQYEAVR